MKPKFLHGVVPVVIEWIDSHSKEGWGDGATAPTDLRVISAGLLIASEPDRIIIAQNKSAYNYGETIEIPRVAVKRIRKLK